MNGKSVSTNNGRDDLPVLYVSKTDCCGCTACKAVCPMNAISMTPDDEGFLYPLIDGNKCVRCYRCLRVCPMKAEDGEE